MRRSPLESESGAGGEANLTFPFLVLGSCWEVRRQKGVDSGLTPNSLTRQELEQKQGRQLERRLGRRLGKQLLSIKPLKLPSKPQWQQLWPSLERQVPNWEKRRATKWEKSPESGGWATLRLGSRRANIQAVGSGSPRPSK